MTMRFGDFLGWFTGSVGRSMIAWLFIASPILLVLDAGYSSSGNFYVRPGPRVVLAYLLILLMVLSLLVLARCVQLNRQRRASAILGYVLQAVRLQMPIVPLLDAAKSAERGQLGKEIGRFRTLLEDGVPLSDALALAAPALPARSMALLTAAQHNGSLAGTLARLAREHRAEPASRIVDRSFRKSYLFVVMMVACIVIAMILIFVIPKFESIFRDFRTELPGATVMLLSIARSIEAFVPLVLLLPLILLWTCGNALREIFTQVPKYRPLRPFFERLAWQLPVVRSVLLNRGMADVCRVVADGVEAGRPAADAIREAAGAHLNPVLRARVEQWAAAVASGARLAVGAREANLPEIVSGMLSATRSGEDIANVFEFLDRYYTTRFSRAAIALDAVTGPLMTFAIALVVLFVAVALITPMVALINTLSAAHFGMARY